eukprot:snap_masked-scaffold_12-processed-gene-3.24-mRNA-1 protein AED:1.00 eAED:1.00 QI:0/-1/0/0/-1/1/1/0/561
MKPLKDISVAIIGGGPVGLFSSILLNRSNIKTKIYEKNVRNVATNFTLSHPKSHVLHPRTMEILRQVNLSEEVKKYVPAQSNWSNFSYGSSVLGNVFTKMNHLETDEAKRSSTLSPEQITQLSQPILEKTLLEAIDHDINYGFEISKNGLNELKRDHDYILVCDGANSMLRKGYGVETQGSKRLEVFASIHFKSKELGEKILRESRESMLNFVFNKKIISVLVSHDLEKGDFVIQVPVFDEKLINQSLASKYKLNKFSNSAIQYTLCGENEVDLEYELLSSRFWTMSALNSEEYAIDNEIFFVGDSAHQFPPSGGFGLNMGLISAHNLCSKIIFQKSNFREYGSGLECYEKERKPVIEETLKVSLENYRRGLEAAKQLGLEKGYLSILKLFGGYLGLDSKDKILEIGRGFLLNTNWKKNISKLNSFVMSGKALPMVFPQVNFGYTYGENRGWEERNKKLEVGSMFPHVYIKTYKGKLISTLDLIKFEPRITVFLMSKKDIRRIKTEVGNSVNLKFVILGPDEMLENEVVVDDFSGELNKIFEMNKVSEIWVRPDQHIARLG